MLVFYLYFGILALKRQPGNNNVTSVLAYLTFKCAFFVYIVVFALPFLEVLFVLFFLQHCCSVFPAAHWIGTGTAIGH